MADNSGRTKLALRVSPFARRGDEIEARIDAVNVSETAVTPGAPDMGNFAAT
jgi:hypothetical protein